MTRQFGSPIKRKNMKPSVRNSADKGTGDWFFPFGWKRNPFERALAVLAREAGECLARRLAMRGNGCGRLRFRVSAIASSLLLSAVVVSGQDTPRPVTSGSSSTELAADVRALTDSIRELQAQVQALHSQGSELRAEEQVAQDETRE